MTTAATPAPLRDAPASSLFIAGLGLVGGSIARAARVAFPGVRIRGADRAAILAVARDSGVIDDAIVLDDADAVDRALRQIADEDGVVILALPVLAVIAFLERHADALKDVVATDTGSTKRDIALCAARLGLRRFVGGHPMAGRATGGLASADARLFEGARWFLSAGDEGNDVDTTALSRLRALVAGLQAQPVEVSAADHDRDVALTSHVPHLLANTLAEAVLEAGAVEAAGGSLKDILKVAGASFDVWGDTIQTNRAAIGAALDDVIDRLRALRGALDDRDRLRELFAHGRALRERLHG